MDRGLMVMATATSRGIGLTKPRQAVAILEAATLTSAVVLLAWLALWFIHRRAEGLRVEAFHLGNESLASGEAPFPEADARAVLGARDGEGPSATPPDGLLDAVRGACSRPGGPVVIYVSAPALDAGPDPALGATTLRMLLEEVATSAKCDVVLALDLAQVDSDRDLNVYANGPYRGLDELAQSIRPGGHALYLLTSAAPAQKSWASEALGRSAFAHYLGRGLSGDARGWDATEIPGRVTVEGLHRYVREHVARWARDYRRAVQTPMLLRVGQPGRPVALAFARPVESTADPKAPEPAKREPAVDAKADAKAAPPKEPRAALLGDVLEEWKRHEVMLDRSPPPYRSHPASFRAYQGMLLRAELRLRQAWNDPGSLEAAREGLRGAARAREELEASLKEDEARENAFPLRAARNEEEGRRAVTEALTYLTGFGPADRALFAPPASPDPPQAAVPDKPDAGPKAAGRPEAPRALADAIPQGYPERFLELQLPAWALRYAREFQVPDAFRDDRRAAILHRLVESRSVAEQALAEDRRGLDWVRPAIARGDDERRRLQDLLFAPEQAEGEAGKELLEAIPAILRAHYEPAARFANTYKEGRATWERASARLPDLAEWSIRVRARRGDGLGADDDPLPPEVARALDDAEALVRALDRPIPDDGAFVSEAQARSEAVAEASRKVDSSLAALEKGLLDSARAEGRGWVEIDAALATPWLPAESRRSLLQAVVRQSERVRVEPDPGSPDADARPPDPGYWALAAGLVALDERLRGLGAGPAADSGAAAAQAREAARGASDSPGASDAAVPAFWKYAESAARLRDRARVERSRRLAGDPKGPSDLQALLRGDDRAVRLLGRGEARRDARPEDGLVDALDRLARFQTLAFHAERLSEDFAADAPAIVQEAAALARSLGLREPRDPFAAGGSLALRTEPPAGSPLRIGDDGRAEVRLGLAPPEAGREDRIPPGRAFVGLAAPPAGLVLEGPGGAAETSPPGGLEEVGPGAAARLDELAVRQLDPTLAGDTFELRAMAFYRGRVDQRAAVPLTVVPRAYAELVKLQIAHDVDDLKARFGEKTAALVEDQFKVHPGEGYMHRGKSAAYRLNFTNVTFSDLTLAFRRTLASPGGGEPEVPIDEEEKSVPLAAGATFSLPGEVTSAQVPMDRPRDLRVAWRVVEKKEPMKPLSVRFRQVDVGRYMTFRPSIGVAEHDRTLQECFIVQFIRRADDPVREPILGREIAGMINGIKTTFAPTQVIMPGKSFTMTQPRTPPGAAKFTWSAEIENDRIQPRESDGP